MPPPTSAEVSTMKCRSRPVLTGPGDKEQGQGTSRCGSGPPNGSIAIPASMEEVIKCCIQCTLP